MSGTSSRLAVDAPPAPPAEATRAGRAAPVVALLATWSLLTVIGRSRMLRDPGTFWHVLTGERILSAGLPTVDWLTFTRSGEPWIAHQWLPDVAMAVLHRAGGLDALLLASTLLVAAVLCGLAARLRSAGVEPRWVLVVGAVAFAAMAGHLHVRPHLVSIALFAWTYALLVDFEAGRSSSRALWVVVPISVVWSNSHGAAMGGIATVLLAAAAWLLAWAAHARSPVSSQRVAAGLVAICAAVAAAPLVTPYGADTIRAWVAIMRSRAISELIVEHGSLVRTRGWQVLPMAALYLAFLLGARRDAALRATAWLPVVWLALAFGRVRHAPLFAVAATLSLPGLLEGNAVVRFLRSHGVTLLADRRGAPPHRAPAVVAVAAVALGAIVVLAAGRGRIARLDPAWWPMDLVPALRSAAGAVPRRPILNDTRLGSFVEYFAPHFAAMSDDRCELFGDEFMFQEAAGDPGWFRGIVRAHDVRHGLAERGSKLDRFLRAEPGWRVVASSRSAVLHVHDPSTRGDVPAALR